MIVKAIKTQKVLPSSETIFEFLDKNLLSLKDRSIVVITSKVVSLCEGSIVPLGNTDKEELIKNEADYYLPAHISKYGYHFTIKNHTLISAAGIDESNAGANYVLWPRDAQKIANEIRQHLKRKLHISNLGIIISDSTCMVLRYGTIGIALAYSGFKPINNYIGTPDLFGRKFRVSQSGVASGLAAAAVVVMGEGTEQTPITVIEDVPFVQFQARGPSQEELDLFALSNKDDDLFAPLLNAVKWEKGGSKK